MLFDDLRRHRQRWPGCFERGEQPLFGLQPLQPISDLLRDHAYWGEGAHDDARSLAAMRDKIQLSTSSSIHATLRLPILIGRGKPCSSIAL
jgi:hypothetical protein